MPIWLRQLAFARSPSPVHDISPKLAVFGRKWDQYRPSHVETVCRAVVAMCGAGRSVWLQNFLWPSPETVQRFALNEFLTHDGVMPCIAQIPGGIKIEMYPDDHHPPHFHAVHAEHEALFRIVDLVVFKGALPTATERLVRDWARNRLPALAFNWVLCVDKQNPRSVP